MSHFTGIVFGHEGALDTVLEPYNENKIVEPYITKTAKELREYVINELIPFVKEQGLNNKYYYNKVIKYNDFVTEEDIQNYIEDEFELDEEGNEISTYSPDSKWDWWVIGGRWSQRLLHISEEEGTDQELKCNLIEIDTPFCFIDLEGNWHEQAKMGWWAMTTDDKDEKVWENEFRDYLNSVSDDTVLTLIDFHI